LRIFYASASTPNAEFRSDIWRNNLYLPLVDLGHEVVEFAYDLQETFQHVDIFNPRQVSFIKENRPRVTEELLRQIRVAHRERPVDLFFSYFYDACVLPEAIEEIRSMGITAVNWYCNGSYQLHLVRKISPKYDWCLVPEKSRIKDYVSMGARPIYCQEAANPHIYRPYPLPLDYDVTFVGQAYGDRPHYIKELLDNGIDVHVWGPGWRKSADGVPEQKQGSIGHDLMDVARILATREGRKAAGDRVRRLLGRAPEPGRRLEGIPDKAVGGVLSDEEMIRLFSRSRINLGFSTCGNTGITGEKIRQVRLRDFEIPMSGGFYIAEYFEELEEFYEFGKEIVCFVSPEDLAEKIRYFLRHEGERERIRKAGFQRCRRDHSWHKRFIDAFAVMGLN